MNFGVLGYGKIVREQIDPAFGLTDHRIVAVGSRSGSRPPGFSGTVHHSYQACIDDPDVEAIYIATPNHLHVPLCIAAMQAGKPVLCEKPIALSIQEFTELEQAQRSTGVTLQEAFMVEHHPQWETLDATALGNNGLLHASFTYGPRRSSDVRSQASLGGGVWWDIGCYGLWACYRLGARQLNRVSGAFRNENGVCVHAQVTLEFEALDAQIEVGSQHFRQQSLSLVTDLGRLRMDRPFNPEGSAARIWDTDVDHVETMHEANQYARMLNSFADAADQGIFLHHDRSKKIAHWSEQVIHRCAQS